MVHYSSGLSERCIRSRTAHQGGVTCGDPKPTLRELQPGVVATSPLIPSCAVEKVFDEKWEDMVDLFTEHFKITKPAALPAVRVPPQFSSDVAPDVEAE